MVDESFSETSTITGDYKLIGADCRDSEVLNTLLENVDKSLPTLVLTECLLVYMKSNDSEIILKWLSDTFPSISVLNYEMINPTDPFGKMMISNLEARGCNLLGYESFPTCESQADRMRMNFG